MKVLMDTNFILACVKQKVDLLDAEKYLEEKIEWIVPKEVLGELKNLSERVGERFVDRNSAKLSLEILALLDPKLIELKNPNIDQGIADYISEKDIVLATLDKKLKKKVKNKIMVLKGRKKLYIV